MTLQKEGMTSLCQTSTKCMKRGRRVTKLLICRKQLKQTPIRCVVSLSMEDQSSQNEVILCFVSTELGRIQLVVGCGLHVVLV